MAGPITITDGGYTQKDPDEILVYQFDWDTLNLAPGVELIDAGLFLITGADGDLTQDSQTLIAGNRRTQVRLGAGTAGVRYTIANRVVTNEIPSQTKERRFYLRIDGATSSAGSSFEIRPVSVTVPRGQPVEIPLDLSTLGTPTPTLKFTLARERNFATKLWTTDVFTIGDPSSVTVPAEQTDLEPETYWWDVWDMDATRLAAIGRLIIVPVVRLP